MATKQLTLEMLDDMVMEELTAGEGEGGGKGKRPGALGRLLELARLKKAEKEVV